MPFIQIYMLEGRSDEVKKTLIEKSHGRLRRRGLWSRGSRSDHDSRRAEIAMGYRGQDCEGSGPVSSFEYQPYDDRTQLARQIPGYPRSFTRTPLQPLIERPMTLSELTGPTGLERRLKIGDGDLSRSVPNGPRAMGQLISVEGQVVDEDGAPVAGAVIEIWQANSSGKYIHELDRHEAPLDPNFIGQGRLLTDAKGQFQFRSIKPGAYPVMESDWWWRPPHIHFSILGSRWMNRFVTQVFFPSR